MKTGELFKVISIYDYNNMSLAMIKLLVSASELPCIKDPKELDLSMRNQN